MKWNEAERQILERHITGSKAKYAKLYSDPLLVDSVEFLAEETCGISASVVPDCKGLALPTCRK